MIIFKSRDAAYDDNDEISLNMKIKRESLKNVIWFAQNVDTADILY